MTVDAGRPLVHVVFFTLREPNPENCSALIAACHKYLADHPGTTYFSAGARAEGYARAVNDQAFDVALVLVFASPADHDRYQSDPRHKQFLEEQSPNWEEVRVFDSFG